MNSLDYLVYIPAFTVHAAIHALSTTVHTRRALRLHVYWSAGTLCYYSTFGVVISRYTRYAFVGCY